jgi:hypothetical protein
MLAGTAKELTASARALGAFSVLLAVMVPTNLRADDMLTQRSNNQRTGSSSASGLSQASVRSFKLLATLAVDAPVLAQPLFTEGVDIVGDRSSTPPVCGGAGRHDVIWIATVTNNIYAFDAKTYGPIFCQPINLGAYYQPTPAEIRCCLPNEAIMARITEGGPPLIGIESTPVIDRELRTMFVSYKIAGRRGGEQRIAALDITNGRVRSRAVPASDLWHKIHRNRASLLLDHGTVFVAFSAVNEEPRKGDYAKSFQGWIHAFDARTLIYRGAWHTMHDPNNAGGDSTDDAVDGGGIWQASTGLSADSEGDLFFATGNAMKPWWPSGPTLPPVPDANNLSNSVVRLKPTRIKVDAPPAGGDPVTMVTQGPSQQHIFYRGLDGSIQHVFWDANEPPHDLHHDAWTRPDSTHATGNPATMVTLAPKQQHIFYRGIDGSIQHVFWDAGEPAGVNHLHRDDWTSLAGAPPAAGAPVTMVTSVPNQQHVFYRDLDGRIQHIFWDAREPPGFLHHDIWTRRGDPLAAGNPATMVTQIPNQQHVFYRGVDGSIQHIFWDASEPPGVNHLHHDSWTSIAPAPLAAGDPTTMVTTAPNQQHVFYRARDRSIQHILWDSSEPPGVLHVDTWTLPSSPKAIGVLATMVTTAPNQQHLFHRATDGSIQHVFWDAAEPPGKLHRDKWTVRGALSAAGDPATMVTSTPNQQHIFYRRSDRLIQHVFWDARDPPGALQVGDWSHLPDAIVMTPADWFTPYRKIWQDVDDMDLSGGGVVLIPFTNFLVAGGKEGIVYLLDKNNLGKFDGTPLVGRCPSQPADDKTRDHAAQKLPVGTNRYLPLGYPQPCGAPPRNNWLVWPHVHGTPVLGNLGNGDVFLYVWPEKDHLQSYRWQGSRFDETPKNATARSGAMVLAPPWKQDHLKTAPVIFGQVGMPGGMLTLGVDPMHPDTGVLFASVQTCGDDLTWHECSANFCGGPTDYSQCIHQKYGMLYAFDPISLKELWNNQQDVAPDRYLFAKFVPPTVAGRKVVLATASHKVLVYGNP